MSRDKHCSQIVFLLVVLSANAARSQTADSLLAVANDQGTDTRKKVMIWRDMLRNGVQTRTAIYDLEAARRVLDDTVSGNGWSWLLMGQLAERVTDFVGSNAYLEKAAESFEQRGEEMGYALAIADIGGNYSVKGEQSVALNRYFDALTILERTGPKVEEAEVWRGLAFIFRYQRNFKKGLEYYRKILAAGQDLGDGRMIMNGLRGEAGILLEQRQLDEARKLYQEALEIGGSLGGERHVAMIRVELANIMFEQGDMLNAKSEFLLALSAFEEKSAEVWLSYTLSRLADACHRLKDERAALRYGERGLAIARENGLLKETLDNLLVLPEVYASMGRYGEALSLSLQYEAFMDSMRNDVTATELTRLEIRQEQVRDSLSREEQRVLDEFSFQASVTKARQQRNLFLFIGLCVLVLVGGLWSRLRYSRRIGKEMTMGNALIEQEMIRAESSEKVKDQFLANMSHEIRTPMNAIMGMTAILKRNAQLPGQERYLDAISQSSGNLLVILNDILDLGRIEDGKVELDEFPFDLRTTLVNVIDILRFKAEEKGLTISLNINEDVPERVVGDATRLNQIMLNLVGNAIKFTEKGGVTMEVSVEGEHGLDHVDGRREEEGLYVRFKVRDTGVGIRPDRIGKIFEEFTQAYSDTTRKYGGTGLGLTITKRLVELQGGTVTVDSSPDEGSTFTVLIRYQRVEDGPSEANSPVEMSSASLDGLRILLAEDNEFNIMVARDELMDAIPGARIDVAHNGRIALEMASASDYDVILMDIQMPEMNGFEATEAIRQLPGPRGHIPIIAMTANVLKSEVDHSMAVGMNAFVPKPFERSDLLEKLKSVVSRNPLSV